MSRGQIVAWRFANELDNDGAIIGCFGTVHGLGFGFSIDDVTDAVLANFLRANPNLERNIDCAAGPAQALWVTFTAAGNKATNITR